MDTVEIVAADRPDAYLLRMDGRDQSYVDLADPTRLVFDYVRRMADVVDAWGEPGAPVRLVHVGGAAMTLPRYVAATRPRSAQVVLEPAAELTELVRRELPLPARSGIKVRPVDGRSGLSVFADDRLDLVLVDAYAQGRVPADLVTTEFADTARRVLVAEGQLVLNLSDHAPFAWTRRVVAALATAFPHLMACVEPATLKGRRGGNLVVVASPTEVPVAALRATAQRSAAPYTVLDPGRVRDTLGGGRPFTDDDTVASPVP